MTNKIIPVIIDNYKFDIGGFTASYTYNGQKTLLTLCPGATCELFKEVSWIEDFTLDSNGEPVLLFTDNTFPPGYGFDRWCSFICCFHITYQMAVKLMEYREDRLQSEKTQATIAYMLQPLHAA